MSKYDSITQEYLQKLFDYKDGQLFWVSSQSRRIKVGNRAGCQKKDGYRFITLNYSNFYEHKLIYMFHFGKTDLEIDHIDGNRSNNRIENLRPATITENARNKKTLTSNTSGRKGISFDKLVKKWRAYIGINGKVKVLGFFENFDDAVKVREKAERENFKEFNRA